MRASWRMSRLAGLSGMLSLSLATTVPSSSAQCDRVRTAHDHLRARQAPLQRHDPMLYRQRGSALQMAETADVGGDYALRRAGVQRGKLVRFQSGRQFRLQERVGAGGAAAQMAVGDRRQLEARRGKDGLDNTCYFLTVLQ